MRHAASTRWVVLAALALAACSFTESGPGYDGGLAGLDISSVQPGLMVPGSTVVVAGRSFVGPELGRARLVLHGSFDDSNGDREVRAVLPLRFVDVERMEATVDDALYLQIGANSGDFHGDATVEVDSVLDGSTHRTRSLGLAFKLRLELQPRLTRVVSEEVIFVNDTLEVTGDHFLLGGAEGSSSAVVRGCFVEAGGATCSPVGPTRVPIEPIGQGRTRGRFRFAPEIAGIRRGRFEGTVAVENRHASGAVIDCDPLDSRLELVESEIHAAEPGAVSLGQYLFLGGGGFVGEGGRTLVRVIGVLEPIGGEPIAIDTVLVPEVVDGRTLRYVVNEDDALGRAIGPRGRGGSLAASFAPLVSFGDAELVGAPLVTELTIAPVKQVVHVDFTPQYQLSLEAFGLRALDGAIRDRILAVVARDYATVNLEVRTTPPDDFAVYSTLEIGGPDPNGLSLLGYDNTPGKDVGNLRLHDRIGGVNAVTQADGFPGFGGVFIESLFVFSEHPGEFVSQSAPDPRFDELFDPFRPDRGGEPVRAADLAGGASIALESGAGCPAPDRRGQIGCAVWALGSLVGSTISHELGHSLGLANPHGPEVHLPGDLPGRLMEAGGGREFIERAELLGSTPGGFCDDEYAYLREILPTDQDADPTPRPGCR